MPCRIPHDVSLEICLCLRSHHSDTFLGRREAREALLQLAYVSRSWCYNSRHVLFRLVKAETTLSFARLLLILRHQCNTIAAHVRAVAIGTPSLRFLGLGERTWADEHVDVRMLHSLLPNLLHLRLDCLNQPTILQHRLFRRLDRQIPPNPQSITTLSVRTDFFAGVRDVYKFLNMFTSLKQLRLNGLYHTLLRSLPTHLPSSLKQLTLRQDEFLTDIQPYELEDNDLQGLPTATMRALEKVHYDNLTSTMLDAASDCLMALLGDASILRITLAAVPCQAPYPGRYSDTDINIEELAQRFADQGHDVSIFEPSHSAVWPPELSQTSSELLCSEEELF